MNCDTLVLPSFTENHGVTVVDALIRGKPRIASRQTPWQALGEHKYGWWVENSPEELARTLHMLMSLDDDERRKMGESGRVFVEERYTWKVVAETMTEAYRRLL